jgi:hypothetical protein
MKSKVNYLLIVTVITIFLIGCGVKKHEGGFLGGKFDVRVTQNSNLDQKSSVNDVEIERKLEKTYRVKNDTLVLVKSNRFFSNSKLISKHEHYSVETKRNLVKRHNSILKSKINKTKREEGSNAKEVFHGIGVFFLVLALIIVVAGFIVGAGQGLNGLMIFATFGLVGALSAIIGAIFYWLGK